MDVDDLYRQLSSDKHDRYNRPAEAPVYRVVISGGPCAGKTIKKLVE